MRVEFKVLSESGRCGDLNEAKVNGSKVNDVSKKLNEKFNNIIELMYVINR